MKKAMKKKMKIKIKTKIKMIIIMTKFQGYKMKICKMKCKINLTKRDNM